jgi:hypothetical protein
MKNTYTLEKINDIIFHGFNYELSEETVKLISELATQVGAPDYVKTPIFQKREHPIKSDDKEKRQKKSNKQLELSDSQWESIRNFQPTIIEEKIGIDVQIDLIRAQLNKLTDKNYIDIRNKICEIIDNILNENINTNDLNRLSTIIFDIASTNRFYSKMYADLYSDLILKYEIMGKIFETNLDKFIDLFNNIEYIDPKVNYDKFCEINKINEKRKSLATFYMNLMDNKIISKEKIIHITKILLEQIYNLLNEENKKNEVDEITENIAILYKKDIYSEETNNITIDGYTINSLINKLAKSKVKDYKSFTNKSLFKFMDMIDI